MIESGSTDELDKFLVWFRAPKMRLQVWFNMGVVGRCLQKNLLLKRCMANSCEFRIGLGFWPSPPHTFFKCLKNLRVGDLPQEGFNIRKECPLRTRLLPKPVNAIFVRVCFHVGTSAEECWPAEIWMGVFVACVSSKELNVSWMPQIVLIDLILHKPEAYRHTFFNYPLLHKLNMLVLDLVLALLLLACANDKF